MLVLFDYVSIGWNLLAWETGSVIVNNAPSISLLSAVIKPLWFSTIFLQIASPIPVPLYKELLFNLWKMVKIFLE